MAQSKIIFLSALMLNVINSSLQHQALSEECCIELACQKKETCSSDDSNFRNSSYLICFPHPQKSIESVQFKNYSESILSDSTAVFPCEFDEISDLTDLSNWKLYASGCTNIAESKRFYYSNENKAFSNWEQNGTVCYTSNIEKIFAPSFCYPFNQECEERFNWHNEILQQNIKIPYIFLGVISLLGNIVVLTQKALGMIKNFGRYKEVQIYNILVLNLSIVDSLMGIYIMVLAVSIDRLAVKGMYDHFLPTNTCNILGVINFISSQISVTCLVIISSFRLWGTLYPYKRVRLKTAYILIAVTWLTWCSIAMIPAINVEPFASFFSYGIRIEKDSQMDVHLLQPEILLRNLVNTLCKDKLNCSKLLKNIAFTYPVLELLHLLNIDFGNYTGSNLGYYNKQSVCSASLIIDDPYSIPSYFTLFVILYNLVSFILILIFYALIMKSLSRDHKQMKYSFICCLSKETTQSSSNNANKKRTQENEAMFRRVFVIVATDFVCWVPICLMSLVFFVRGYYSINRDCAISSQFCFDLKLYHSFQTAVCIIVPLNSVINPYIYSYNFWKNLFITIKNRLKNFFASF